MSSSTMREILLRLGLAPRGGNYETVRQRMVDLGLQTATVRVVKRGRPLGACSDDEVGDAVRSSRSVAQVVTRLALRPGGNQSRLSQRIQSLALDTSHFMGQAWRRGSTTPSVPARPLTELLVVGLSVQTNRLKKRLIEEGWREHRCESCLRDSWNGRPIPLELDHINGRRDDNRLANLRMLCPNCHAQTPTYRGRNIGVLPDV